MSNYPVHLNLLKTFIKIIHVVLNCVLACNHVIIGTLIDSCGMFKYKHCISCLELEMNQCLLKNEQLYSFNFL